MSSNGSENDSLDHLANHGGGGSDDTSSAMNDFFFNASLDALLSNNSEELNSINSHMNVQSMMTSLQHSLQAQQQTYCQGSNNTNTNITLSEASGGGTSAAAVAENPEQALWGSFPQQQQPAADPSSFFDPNQLWPLHCMGPYSTASTLSLNNNNGNANNLQSFLSFATPTPFNNNNNVAVNMLQQQQQQPMQPVVFSINPTMYYQPQPMMDQAQQQQQMLAVAQQQQQQQGNNSFQVFGMTMQLNGGNNNTMNLSFLPPNGTVSGEQDSAMFSFTNDHASSLGTSGQPQALQAQESVLPVTTESHEDQKPAACVVGSTRENLLPSNAPVTSLGTGVQEAISGGCCNGGSSSNEERREGVPTTIAMPTLFGRPVQLPGPLQKPSKPVSQHQLDVQKQQQSQPSVASYPQAKQEKVLKPPPPSAIAAAGSESASATIPATASSDQGTDKPPLSTSMSFRPYQTHLQAAAAMGRRGSSSMSVTSDANSQTMSRGGGGGKKRSSATDDVCISEDEGERQRRRFDRNAREQQRSQQITHQIGYLKQVLSEANVPFKPDKYSTLSTVVTYVKQLQERSQLLDDEHQKLINTISETTEIVNNCYQPAHVAAAAGASYSNNKNGNSNFMGDSDDPLESPISMFCSDDAADGAQFAIRPRGDSGAMEDGRISPLEDETMVFVKGIDYKSIFISCPFPSAITSLDGRFLDLNKDFEEVSGFTRHEILPLEAKDSKADEVSSSQTGERQPSTAMPKFGLGEDDGDGLNIGNGSLFHPQQERNLSLFNILHKRDMERVFTSMSSMIRLPFDDDEQVVDKKGGKGKDTTTTTGSSPNPDKNCSSDESEVQDFWSDEVTLNRKPTVWAKLNITLVRTSQGRPRFFNCTLITRE